MHFDDDSKATDVHQSSTYRRRLPQASVQFQQRTGYKAKELGEGWNKSKRAVSIKQNCEVLSCREIPNRYAYSSSEVSSRKRKSSTTAAR